MGRNPKTGASVKLHGKYVPHFKSGKELRERVNDSMFDASSGTMATINAMPMTPRRSRQRLIAPAGRCDAKSLPYFLILVLLLIFMAAFLFVTANTQPVTLAVPVADWQYQVTLGGTGVLVVLLALGLLAGLVTGLGLKGVAWPVRTPFMAGRAALAYSAVLFRHRHGLFPRPA